MFKLIAFIFFSAVIVFISRGSLLSPRSHGFYRFFSWEFILALILLNIDVWVHNPFAWRQIVSWVLLFGCIVPLVLGARSLTEKGKASEHREDDDQLFAFEKTTSLVTTGIYKYIRHPLYSSLLLLAWGTYFKAPSWSGLLLALAASISLFATAMADEAECIRFFGAPYQEYMKGTKRFVPFMF